MHDNKSLKKPLKNMKKGVEWGRPREEAALKKRVEQMMERKPEKRPTAEDCKRKLRQFIASDEGQ